MFSTMIVGIFMGSTHVHDFNAGPLSFAFHLMHSVAKILVYIYVYYIL